MDIFIAVILWPVWALVGLLVGQARGHGGVGFLLGLLLGPLGCWIAAACESRTQCEACGTFRAVGFVVCPACGKGRVEPTRERPPPVARLRGLSDEEAAALLGPAPSRR